MFEIMHRFLRAEEGTTAIEYGLISALIVLTIFSSIQLLGQSMMSKLYSGLASLF